MKVGRRQHNLGLWRELLLRAIPPRRLRWRLEAQLIDGYVRRSLEASERSVAATLRRDRPELFRDPAAMAEYLAELRRDLVGTYGFARFLRQRLLALGDPGETVERTVAHFERLARRRERKSRS